MVKLTSIESNRQWLDGGSMFGNAPRAVWQKWTEVDEQGRIPLACRCLLIEYNDLKILCETGIGAFFEPKLAKRFGVQDGDQNQLVLNLEKTGVSPDEIDYVILSHLHFDHAGGLLPSFQEIQSGKDDIVFSKATFLVGEKAWQRALTPHSRDRASFIPLINDKLESCGRMQLIKDQQVPSELKDIIEFFESDGHTPGQLHTLIKGEDKTLVYAGDLIPGVAWVHLPITMGYDRFPEKLIDEKNKLYQKFSGENFAIFFTHDPIYAMGHLQKNEKGHFTVTQLQETLNRLEF